jgi:FkbM family methyltransferase
MASHFARRIRPAQKFFYRFMERLDEALKPGAEVFVYGSGMVARELLGALRSAEVRVRGVVDGNTTRTEVDGRPIRRPDDPGISAAERGSIPLLLGLFNRDVDVGALIRKLRGQGWGRIVDFVEVHAHWPDRLQDRYWLTGREFYGRHREKIEKMDGLWADAASRELYRGILNFRRSGRREGLPEPDGPSQYSPEDVPGWKTPLRLIDAGAFDGDTIRGLRKRGVPIEAVAALEPDPGNFAKLVADLRAAERDHPCEWSAWPCGVWHRTEQVRFSPEGGEASAVRESGEAVIQCVALDDVLPHFRPTLIKLDIEGAERAALEGARRLIAESRSGLAVCVYHRPGDLWEIPLLLDGWKLGHRFFLRSHAYSGFELVLYAVAG